MWDCGGDFELLLYNKFKFLVESGSMFVLELSTASFSKEGCHVLLMLNDSFGHVQIAVAAIIPLADKCPACPSVFQTDLHPKPL